MKRLLLLLLLLLPLACRQQVATDVAGGFQARPEGTGQEKVVASVLLQSGSLTVVPRQGQPFASKPGSPLFVSDLLRLKTASYVVLQLHNNYVLRLDEEMELRVGDLVMLKAAATSEKFSAQLLALLAAQEQTQLAAVTKRAQQMAGWYATRTAADSFVQAGRPAPTVMREKGPPPKKMVKGKRGSLEIAPQQEDSLATASDSTAPAAVDDREEATDEGLVVESHAALASCLAKAIAVLPREVQEDAKRVQVILWLRQNKVERIALGRGLAAPQCAKDILLGASIAEAPVQGRQRIEFNLK